MLQYARCVTNDTAGVRPRSSVRPQLPNIIVKMPKYNGSTVARSIASKMGDNIKRSSAWSMGQGPSALLHHRLVVPRRKSESHYSEVLIWPPVSGRSGSRVTIGRPWWWRKASQQRCAAGQSFLKRGLCIPAALRSGMNGADKLFAVYWYSEQLSGSQPFWATRQEI